MPESKNACNAEGPEYGPDGALGEAGVDDGLGGVRTL